ncbi:hypothetical protein BH721_11790 [Clostridium baratii]|uniref:Limonene-1,2-epoxide hydrolase n=1 Tax=Clostridium baratii TaxID=1561 RepID=A0A174VBA0_9CLOT|nr:nuclear transport factor 2 family protein [Clostridium baratii]OPF52326.1 hypothetical protein A1M12_13125 [Clostridium baratii]OPF54634.1 hypothetical protein BH724_14170 [Clostridium baratii]OPF57790.1 hypothetical protein BH721_11790 [Clostridium baratii]OPF61307.1 hypothetical protein BH725_12880 [Clostridium baratii]CUQ32093.1 Limonene-1%2C2-epoxide hydrolase [Clostridium baratii]
MEEREKIVREYFESWIKNNISVIENNFSEDILYIESWGPAYRGIEEVKLWFKNWNKSSKVLCWEVKDIMLVDNKVICEWYFKHKHKEEVNDFNGVSLISFNDNNKITEVKEFMSVLPLRYPYSKIEI